MEKLSVQRPMNPNALKTNHAKTELRLLDQFIAQQDLDAIEAVEQRRGTSAALSRDKIMQSLSSRSDQWYGTYHHDELVGFCMIDALDRYEANLNNIGVCLEHQGQGFGTDLLGKAVTDYLQRNNQSGRYLDRVKLYVFPNNQRAIKLFKKFGFQNDDFCRFLMSVRQDDFMVHAHQFAPNNCTQSPAEFTIER